VAQYCISSQAALQSRCGAILHLLSSITTAYADEGMNLDEYIASRKSDDEREAVRIVFGLVGELSEELECMEEAPANFLTKR
jgi:hypothetical protein